MARSRGREHDPKAIGHSARADWSALKWNDIERFAGSRGTASGQAYQRQGRVKNLKLSPDGELLATVVGTHSYSVTIAIRKGGGGPALEAVCTCPIERSRCKHVVAVVAEYLEAVAEGRDVPVANYDDPRWTRLNGEAAERVADRDDVAASTPTGPAGDWDGKIRQHLRTRSQTDLADLIWSLARRFPAIHQELRERVALQEGDRERLAAEARQEIQRVTSEPAWRDDATGEGQGPDYGPIRQRFERLLELGHHDLAVSLGRLFIPRALRQVRDAYDHGTTANAFAACLPPLYLAVLRSSLSGSEKLLFAIDAELTEGSEALGNASRLLFTASFRPEDWSAVADTLTERLRSTTAEPQRTAMRVARDETGDRLRPWIARALREAGHDQASRTPSES